MKPSYTFFYRGIVSLILFLSPFLLAAQQRDTLILTEIEVTASRFQIPDSDSPNSITTLNATQVTPRSGLTVGSMLKNHHGLSVRSYGPGAIQTAGMQGFGTSSIKVVWNGMELNHSMLGLTDLSLIPAILLDEVRINSSAGSSEYGGNVLGGLLEISTMSTDSDTRFGVRFGAGSYGIFEQSAMYSTRLNRIGIVSAVTFNQQRNDFEYTDVSANPPSVRRRTNAAKNLHAALLQVRYVGERYHNNTSLWYGNTNTQVPGSILAPSSKAYQDDITLRLSHRGDFVITPGMVLGYHGSIGRHQLDFVDNPSNINSLSKSYTLNTGVDLLKKITPQFSIKGHTAIGFHSIDASEYEAPDLFHLSGQLNSHLKLVSEKLSLFPSMRFDSYSEFGNALTWGSGFNLALSRSEVRFFGSFNRNFAPPTYNDLYWPELGNPDLVPEIAYKAELGVRYNIGEFHAEAHIFGNEIENGIRWLPGPGGRFRPSNIESIHSRGLGIKAGNSYRVWEIDLTFSAGWTWLRAVYGSERFEGDQAKGKQVIYQPEHKANALVDITWKSYTMLFNIQGIGTRYTTEDHAFSIPPFSTTDVSVLRVIQLSPFSGTISFTVENLFNEDYAYIRWYPMPGRMYHINLSINLTK